MTDSLWHGILYELTSFGLEIAVDDDGFYALRYDLFDVYIYMYIYTYHTGREDSRLLQYIERKKERKKTGLYIKSLADHGNGYASTEPAASTILHILIFPPPRRKKPPINNQKRQQKQKSKLQLPTKCNKTHTWTSAHLGYGRDLVGGPRGGPDTLARPALCGARKNYPTEVRGRPRMEISRG